MSKAAVTCDTNEIKCIIKPRTIWISSALDSHAASTIFSAEQPAVSLNAKQLSELVWNVPLFSILASFPFHSILQSLLISRSSKLSLVALKSLEEMQDGTVQIGDHLHSEALRAAD